MAGRLILTPLDGGCVRQALVLSVLVVATACSSAETVATIEGEPVEHSELAELFPEESDATEQELASSLMILILHDLLIEAARDHFGFTVSQESHQSAFQARTRGLGSDLDATLAARGLTRERVALEADLDVIRAELEDRLVRDEAPGLDLDAAYRTFLSVNSRVCLSAWRITNDSAVGDIEVLLEGGGGLANVEQAYPDVLEPVDLECTSPTLFGLGLASVALDGEVGKAHVVKTEQGPVITAVVEREAPSAQEVRDEVLQVAAETQGPELFNEWAAEVLRNADVKIDGSVGRWEPAQGTGDIPTIVAS